jgi:hypothetical protein
MTDRPALVVATPARHRGRVTGSFDTISFIGPEEGGQPIKCYAFLGGKCLPIGLQLSYELGSNVHDGTPVAINMKVAESGYQKQE